jgi:hypothetical protein
METLFELPEPLDDIELKATAEVNHLIDQVNDFLALARLSEDEADRLENLEDALWIYQHTESHIKYNLHKTIKEDNYGRRDFLLACKKLKGDLLDAGIEAAIIKLGGLLLQGKIKEASELYYDLDEDIYDNIAEIVSNSHSTRKELRAKLVPIVSQIDGLLEIPEDEDEEAIRILKQDQEEDEA